MCESLELDLVHLGGLHCRVTIRDQDHGLFVSYRLLDPDRLPVRIRDQDFFIRQFDDFCSAIQVGQKPSLPPGWDFMR